MSDFKSNRRVVLLISCWFFFIPGCGFELRSYEGFEGIESVSLTGAMSTEFRWQLEREFKRRGLSIVSTAGDLHVEIERIDEEVIPIRYATSGEAIEYHRQMHLRARIKLTQDVDFRMIEMKDSIRYRTDAEAILGSYENSETAGRDNVIGLVAGLLRTIETELRVKG